MRQYFKHRTSGKFGEPKTLLKSATTYMALFYCDLLFDSFFQENYVIPKSAKDLEKTKICHRFDLFGICNVIFAINWKSP